MSRRRSHPIASSTWRVVLALITCSVVFSARPASAQELTRDVNFEWNAEKSLLFASMSYRDVVDANVKHKLTRGLPTTIAMTATLFRSGSNQPVATTVQTCKVTWHVWEEAYKIELVRPGTNRTRWTTTLEGVLRRCAEARSLLVATNSQITVGSAVYLRAKVQVNPLSAKLLEKIKRWVSRPSATGTAGPGDALFGTFTGLFLQRVGDAERELKFTSKAAYPKIRPKPNKSES